MSVNIRLPSINALTEREQIAQIKSYLRQLVEQLNFALSEIGTGSGSTQTTSSKTYEVQGDDLDYYELRTLIIQELEEVQTLFDKLAAKMESEYLKEEELQTAIDEALAQAKASGEFDGPQGEQGVQGEQGIQGDPGQDGYTPQKGVDYFTEEEVDSVAKQAAGMISFTLDEDGNLYFEVEE